MQTGALHRDAFRTQVAQRGDAGRVGGAQVHEIEDDRVGVVADFPLEVVHGIGRQAAFHRDPTETRRFPDCDAHGHTATESKFGAVPRHSLRATAASRCRL